MSVDPKNGLMSSVVSRFCDYLSKKQRSAKKIRSRQLRSELLETRDLMATVSPIVGVNLVNNGSFETPILNDIGSNTTWTDVPNGAEIAPWVSSNGYFEIQTNKLWANKSFYPSDGRQMVELDGDLTTNRHTSTTITQVVSGLIPGGTYSFSFKAGGRPDTTASENKVHALVQDSKGTRLWDYNTPNVNPKAWVSNKTVFTVNDTQVTISFSDAGIVDNKQGSLIDDVRLLLTKPPGSYITDYRSATTIGNIPLESTSGFSVQPNEHMDNKSTFTFKVEGPMRNLATVRRGVFQVTEANGTTTNTQIGSLSRGTVTGTTVDNSYKLDLSNGAFRIPANATYNKYYVEFFNDLNNNAKADVGEEDVKTPTFIVMPFTERKVKTLYSDRLITGITSEATLKTQVESVFLTSSKLLQKRDSVSDSRAIVNVILDPSVRINNVPTSYNGFQKATSWSGASGTPAPPSPALIDPVTSDGDINRNLGAGATARYALSIVSSLPSGTYGKTNKLFGFSNSIVDWNNKRTATVIHELGHGFGLDHPGHNSNDIMFTPAENSIVGNSDPRVELRPEDVAAFDGIN